MKYEIMHNKWLREYQVIAIQDNGHRLNLFWNTKILTKWGAKRLLKYHIKREEQKKRDNHWSTVEVL